ncbi:MAG: hypothetical protein HGA36_01010 [Candidatus Moranbacteria bacterium]|nr:hypothetical protein [Candidatus Moranbacteria bacterium]
MEIKLFSVTRNLINQSVIRKTYCADGVIHFTENVYPDTGEEGGGLVEFVLCDGTCRQSNHHNLDLEYIELQIGRARRGKEMQW